MKTKVITPDPAPSRKAVLRLTWQLVKQAGLTFADALKRAWATLRLTAQMSQQATTFFYRKDDGSERCAIGFNRVAPDRVEANRPAKKHNPLVITYYDLQANGWRSFRADRLILQWAE